MSAAVLYIGYHYNQVDTNSINGKIRHVDWRQTFRNQQTYLINPLKARGLQVDTYMSTYHSNLEEQMLEDIKPTRWNFYTLEGRFLTDGPWGRLQNVLKCLELVEQSPHTYDYIIPVRFDLMLLQPISELDIDYSKFNVTFLNYDGLTYDDFFTFSVIPQALYKKIAEYIRSNRIQQRFLQGGYCNHVLVADFESRVCQPHLMVRNGKYMRGQGWQVNINPIYFLPSQMVDVKCYLCYGDYNSSNPKHIVPCGCHYHSSCYTSWDMYNNGCVLCRNRHVMTCEYAEN